MGQTDIPATDPVNLKKSEEPVKKMRKTIVLTVVIAGAGMLLICLALVLILNNIFSTRSKLTGDVNVTATVTPTPEEDGPPTLTPTIIEVPGETEAPKQVDKNNVWFKNAENSRYQLMGECVGYGDGSTDPKYCVLKDTVKNKIVYDLFIKSDDANRVTMGLYTVAYLGAETDKGVIIFATGGEGGDSWGSAYKFDAQTETTVLVGKYGYIIPDFNDLRDYIIKDTPECQGGDAEDKTECRIPIQFKQTAACLDHLKETAYEASCIATIEQMSQEWVDHIVNVHNKSKEGFKAEALLNKDYGMEYFHLKMRFRVMATADPGCQDFTQEEAYTSACLTPFEEFGSYDTQEDFLKETAKLQKIVQLIGYPGYSWELL